MRILSRCVVALLTLGACAGDVGKQPDAGPPACTQVLYDSCLTEHDCMSGICRPFADSGFTVCTMACTVGDDTSCGGAGATCNAMALCKPVAANDCVIKP